MELWSMETLVNAEHVTNEFHLCWCQPKIEHVLPFGELTIHRHFWDRPEYGEE